MGDDRSTVDSILDGLEILDEDGPRLIERAFGDEIPSCMDDFADPDDSMWRNGDGRDVLWDLLLDHPLLDPMHGIALDPYVADSEHPDVIIRLFDTSFVDDLSGRGAVARIPVDDGHMDALVAMCERIAHDGRWVASGTDPRETLRRCEEVVRRCQRIEREVNDWEANARKRGQREAMRQGGERAALAPFSGQGDLEAKLRELAQMDREREAAEAAARQAPAPGSATPQAMTRAAIACAARSDDGETTCGMGLRIRKPA